MTTTKLVTVGKTRKTFHRAIILEGVTNRVTLCSREWSDKIMNEAELDKMGECKLCRKAWLALAEPQRKTSDKINSEASQGSDQQECPSDDASLDCNPVFDTNGEIVIFDGREWALNYWQRDQFSPRDTDRDWLNLRATDGSGSITIQRLDLIEPVPASQVVNEPEFLTVGDFEVSEVPSVTDLLAELDTNPWDVPSVTIPRPRPPFTPADMDALNLRRRVGSRVKVQSCPGTARIVAVSPRGVSYPLVSVCFPDGLVIPVGLADVLLT